MISFSLSDEQLALKDMVAKFVEKEITPVAAKLDETGEFPHDIVKKAHEVGILNGAIPQELGGLGLGVLDEVIIEEELGAGCLAISTTLAVNNLGLYPIILFGTKEQKNEFVVPFLNEPKLASFCLTEAGAGSDPASLTTIAKEEKDHFVINGSKMFITNAGYASLFTVFCTTNKDLKTKGLLCLAVPADAPGVSIGKPEKKMGQKASNTCSITFENVKVPKNHLIGKVGGGLKVALATLDHTRPTVSSTAVGAARAALEHSIKYSKERKQFNKPIAAFQAIQFMLADMATKVEAARALCYQAGWHIDQGNHKLGNYFSSHAKRFAADMAMEVATDAVQIFGGYGYTKEYPVEKIMRDVKLVQIYEGTSQVQRIVIARHLLKD